MNIETNNNENVENCARSITEEQIITEKEYRDKCINRVEVLDKIKDLLLIPGTNAMTIKQVADYYEVDIGTINMCYLRNRDEIDSDGTIYKKASEVKTFLAKQNVQLENKKGKTLFNLSNMTIEIPNAGIKIFPKRAVLRMGMLLRDSKVAKEIRSQLLNAFEKTTDEQKTEEIYNEQSLIFDLGKAYINKDFDGLVVATQNYIDYQNRYSIALEKANQQLEADNKYLAGEELKWTNRNNLNRAIRVLAGHAHIGFGEAWNILYKQLQYKHGIVLRMRGEAPFIQHIKKEEWRKVLQSFSAICNLNNISPSKILEELTFERGKDD